jgi:hypothetical protein
MPRLSEPEGFSYGAGTKRVYKLSPPLLEVVTPMSSCDITLPFY